MLLQEVSLLIECMQTQESNVKKKIELSQNIPICGKKLLKHKGLFAAEQSHEHIEFVDRKCFFCPATCQWPWRPSPLSDHWSCSASGQQRCRWKLSEPRAVHRHRAGSAVHHDELSGGTAGQRREHRPVHPETVPDQQPVHP